MGDAVAVGSGQGVRGGGVDAPHLEKGASTLLSVTQGETIRADRLRSARCGQRHPAHCRRDGPTRAGPRRRDTDRAFLCSLGLEASHELHLVPVVEDGPDMTRPIRWRRTAGSGMFRVLPSARRPISSPQRMYDDVGLEVDRPVAK